MARFLVERDFGQISDQEMEALALRSDDLIAERFPEIVWEHSHVCGGDDGSILTYCVYEAPDIKAVHEHAEALGDHQITKVYEIAGDITPNDLVH
ncbi:MAG: nickel-binding protein [Thermoleophilaceae bacterium]